MAQIVRRPPALGPKPRFIRKLKFVGFRDLPLGNFQERYK